MTFIRSVLFNISFVTVTLPYIVLGPCLFFFMPRRFHSFSSKWWAWTVVKCAAVLGGVKYKIEGVENLPQDSNFIIASKHQSAYETFVFKMFFENLAFILKRELVMLPFPGWQIRMTGAIAIDRGSGAKAMKKILSGAKNRLNRGQPVLISPEGTRTKPGEKPVYHPGVALLYQYLPDTPVIPVALNSGVFWHKNSGIKRTGTVTVKILPAMPRGLDKKEFMTTLENRIETACTELS